LTSVGTLTALSVSGNLTVTGTTNSIARYLTITGGAFGSAVPGSHLEMSRNTSGGGAPSLIQMRDKDGTSYYIYIKAGAFHVSTATAVEGSIPDGAVGIFGGTIGSAPAGSLTGTTLASNVVTSSLTTVGTLGSLSVTNNVNVGAHAIVQGNVRLDVGDVLFDGTIASQRVMWDAGGNGAILRYGAADTIYVRNRVDTAYGALNAGSVWLEQVNPTATWYDTTGASDERKSRFLHTASALYLRALNDDNTTKYDIFVASAADGTVNFPQGAKVNGDNVLTTADAGTSGHVEVEQPGGGGSFFIDFNSLGFYTGTS
jgi:hypothetical protein